MAKCNSLHNFSPVDSSFCHGNYHFASLHNVDDYSAILKKVQMSVTNKKLLYIIDWQLTPELPENPDGGPPIKEK